MKMNGIIFLAIILLSSCSTLKGEQKTFKEKLQSFKSTFKAKKDFIYPGHVKLVTLTIPKELSSVDLICGGKKVKSWRDGNEFKSYVSSSYHKKKGKLNCDIKISDGTILSAFVFNITKYKFKETKLNVPKKHVDLSPKNLKRYLKEKARQVKVYSSGVTEPYFTKKFVRPLDSKLTGNYGTKRVFNNKKFSWHSGTDFRAPTGTEIPAANRGKVVFTGHLFFNGNTVIIDHGAGIFTMYCHMSKILSKEGEMVSQKDIIGLSGNTGRSTAPHLHWGAKVNGNWVKGLSLIEQGH